MVLVGPDQHADALAVANALGDVEQSDNPVDAGRRTRSGEDDAAILVRLDGPSDGGTRRLAQPRRMGAAMRGFGVAVGVIGEHPLQHEILDLA